MTATLVADALSAPQSLPRLVTGDETTNRSSVGLRTQESANPPEGVGTPRPIHLAGSVRHPACGTHWSGSWTAHCARCHLTTTGLRAFEAHQRIVDGILHCLSPDMAGLVPLQRPSGTVWSRPGGGASWWEFES